MISPIVLSNETAGSPIKVRIDHTKAGAMYDVVFSTTITINRYNQSHMDLIQKINSQDPNDPNIVDESINYISIIGIRVSTAIQQPVEIRGLKYLEDIPIDVIPNNLAIVVAVKDATVSELLHKPKRTMGKVSNGLG